MKKYTLYEFAQIVECLQDPDGYLGDLSLSEWLEDVDIKPPTKELLRSIEEIKDDIKVIVHGQEMSENHLGGNDIINYFDEALKAIRDGFVHVYTEYGELSEATVLCSKTRFHGDKIKTDIDSATYYCLDPFVNAGKEK